MRSGIFGEATDIFVRARIAYIAQKVPRLRVSRASSSKWAATIALASLGKLLYDDKTLVSQGPKHWKEKLQKWRKKNPLSMPKEEKNEKEAEDSHMVSLKFAYGKRQKMFQSLQMNRFTDEATFTIDLSSKKYALNVPQGKITHGELPQRQTRRET